MKEHNSKYSVLLNWFVLMCWTVILFSAFRSVPDMDQLYEQWLQAQKTGWGEETSSNSFRENGKQIHMPTDYAEEVVSFTLGQYWPVIVNL